MADIISWDKAIGKKVKSTDNEDLGKVQSITKDYIQTKEGMVSKNYYYIPKYYLRGYDGDNLWVSLTKDEVKSRFEREDPPDLSEWETKDYAAQREQVMRDHPDFATSIPAYTSSSSYAKAETATTAAAAQPSSYPAPDMVPMPWDRVIGKKVKSSDRKDLGDVESISSMYVEVKEGIVNKKRYYLPKHFIEGYDGDALHASLTKDEVKERYERDSPPSPAELRSPEYMGLTAAGLQAAETQTLHGVPVMAKEPPTEIPVDYSGSTYNVPWDRLIHQHVRTSDNVEIGYVERIGNEFIVVREGVANVHIFYVPKAYIREYDGSQLWIDAPSDLVRAKFELEKEPSQEELRALAREAPRFRRARTASPEERQAQREAAATTATSTTTTAPATTAADSPGNVVVEEKIELDEQGNVKRTAVETG